MYDNTPNRLEASYRRVEKTQVSSLPVQGAAEVLTTASFSLPYGRKRWSRPRRNRESGSR